MRHFKQTKTSKQANALWDAYLTHSFLDKCTFLCYVKIVCNLAITQISEHSLYYYLLLVICIQIKSFAAVGKGGDLIRNSLIITQTQTTIKIRIDFKLFLLFSAFRRTNEEHKRSKICDKSSASRWILCQQIMCSIMASLRIGSIISCVLINIFSNSAEVRIKWIIHHVSQK